MCIPNSIQHKIHKRTGNGDMIAIFLVDTMQGQHTDAKFNHRMEAAKHLFKYGFTDADCETTSDRLSRAGGNPAGQGGDETSVQSPLSPRETCLPLRKQGVRVRETENTPSSLMTEGRDGDEVSPPSSAPVTHLDILNYEIAHLIRHETAEGHTVVEFLIHIIERQGQAIHTQEVPHKARRPHGSRKRTPATRLRRTRLTPQAVRHQRRSKRLRHPAHRPRQGECESTASAAPTPSASSRK